MAGGQVTEVATKGAAVATAAKAKGTADGTAAGKATVAGTLAILTAETATVVEVATTGIPSLHRMARLRRTHLLLLVLRKQLVHLQQFKARRLNRRHHLLYRL